ncbi:mitochondrial splicing system protein [Puccinia graminis f. sp. tritici]|uniref:Mitochondrial splicing system protein n=1 Tax=Puccinia graminis f. sp. tritici TaxID=56615 RepID=A0A5B0MZE7_PUCGR|nr:mitochondrial splicing system protein [Puccinia graminis f. sp. tritici]
MDINKVLGLKHLIEAETEEQRRWAVSEFDVSSSAIRFSLCLLILTFDHRFSEDGSMDDREIWNQVIDHLLDLQSTINAQLSQSKRREKISMGIKVSLYGSPNVGKINREAAIVSPYPGTTRDIIELSIDYHTAGLRSSTDPVEEIGINRAKENIGKADVRLLLVSAVDMDSFDSQDSILKQEVQDNRPTMILVTKTDLLIDSPEQIEGIVKKLDHHFPGVPVHPISVFDQIDQHGMSQFIKSFENHLRSSYGSEASENQNSFYLTNYQKIQLEKILSHIEGFISRLRSHLSGREDDNQQLEDLDLVILIEELRLVSGLLANYPSLIFRPLNSIIITLRTKFRQTKYWVKCAYSALPNTL